MTNQGASARPGPFGSAVALPSFAGRDEDDLRSCWFSETRSSIYLVVEFSDEHEQRRNPGVHSLLANFD